MSEDRAPTIRVAIIAGMPWLDDRYVRQKNDERRFSPGTRRREGRWISAWAPHAAALLPRKLPPRGPGPRFIASWRIQCREDVEMFYKSIIAATGVSPLPDRPAPQISPMPVGPLLSNNSRNRLQPRTYLSVRLRIRIQPPTRGRHRWFLQTVQVPPPYRGMADSLDEAKAAFAKRNAEVKKAR